MDNLLYLVKDHSGSRLIQKKIEDKNQKFLTAMYEKVIIRTYKVFR